MKDYSADTDENPSDVLTRVPEWRPLLDMRENYFYDIPAVRTPRRDKGHKRPPKDRIAGSVLPTPP
jgi:hypothetical protein